MSMKATAVMQQWRIVRKDMTNVCTSCGQTFEVSKDDQDFHDRASPVINNKKYPIPPPTLCPTCRWQRRIAWRNERTLYKRKCDLTGREMISMHPGDSPFPVYYITDWLSDRWDATEYGRDFDFNRPFFSQFKELCDTVPHFNLFIDPQMDENSEYTNCSSEAKNCYLISQAEKNEDCYHSRGINNCKDCCDCLRVNHCELCYECINASNCFQSLFSQDVDHCSDCFFCSDCRSCKHCFGCHGLHQKEYHIFNQPVSKEEWEEKIGKLVWTREVIGQMQERSDIERLRTPQRWARIIQCEDSTGDHISECRNSNLVFDSKNLEFCSYCYELLNGARYCHDFSMWGLRCELLYECNGCGYDVYRTLFSNHCWQGITDVCYSDSCFPSVKNCFGCFGVKRRQYCVLNKQYSREEYETLVPRIIEHMIATGEWGQFFPMELSPFAYNEGLAGEFFPLSKQEVEKRGLKWREKQELSENAEDAVFCDVTGRPFRIVSRERAFYERLNLPLPHLHPDERHRRRVAKRNPRKLWDRKCQKCRASIQTSYSPDRPEIVYCEKCYLQTVY